MIVSGIVAVTILVVFPIAMFLLGGLALMFISEWGNKKYKHRLEIKAAKIVSATN